MPGNAARQTQAKGFYFTSLFDDISTVRRLGVSTDHVAAHFTWLLSMAGTALFASGAAAAVTARAERAEHARYNVRSHWLRR
jgi:hypothetical protein